MNVLIIDDDPDFRSLLRSYLTQQWPHVRVDDYDPLERDVPDASFPLATYDVLILDYMLGRGDGLAWLETMKRRADCPPVLFITGAGNEIIAVRAMKAGANDYQRKQELTRDVLLASIRDLARDKVEKTVPPEVAARIEAHSFGARFRIPGIRILRLIAEGGLSRVYLASRDQDDEPLVVKILREDVSSDEDTLRRFMEEYALVERLNSPHVAKIYGHGVVDGYAYLVMEFFDGGDMSKRMGGQPFATNDALRIFVELMYALGDIHEQGVLHRDLKPQNLMFRADGSLAIVDFGIAKQIDAIDRTGHGEILGTPRYMSPEQVQGRALDLRTDIYSAGVLFYQMLVGKRLFDGDTAIEVALHHVNTAPPPLPPQLSKYQRLLDKLLEKDREARFRNADEVIGFLARKFQQGGPG